VDTLIKKLVELETIKKLIFTNNQRKLMKYHYKYLNFENPEETLDYLNSIQEKQVIENDIFDKEEIQIDKDLNLVNDFNKYYNF